MPTILVLERPERICTQWLSMQLDRDVAVGQQLDVVVELARGNGAGAGLLDLGAQEVVMRLVEIGGGDGETAFGLVGFEQEIGQDGDGGLALDDGLGGGELTEQFLLADGDLHGESLNGVLVCFESYAGHVRLPEMGCGAWMDCPHSTPEMRPECSNPNVTILRATGAWKAGRFAGNQDSLPGQRRVWR